MRELLPGIRAIERVVDELDRERMRREVEIFAVALARDLVTASPTSRPTGADSAGRPTP